MDRKLGDFSTRDDPRFSNHALFTGARSSLHKEKLYDVQALQNKVLQYQKENAALHRELELKETKLSSCMRSLELFWSPELNKEREARKRDGDRLAVVTAECDSLRERLKAKEQEVSNLVTQLEEMPQTTHQCSQHHSICKARLHGDVLSSNASDTDSSPTLSPQRGNDSKSSFSASPGQVAELQALRKTLDEMELRVSSQKSALAQREETIKKLLERLQDKTAEVNLLQEQLNKFNMSEMSFKLDAAEAEIAALNAKSTKHEFAHMKASKRQRDLFEQLRQTQLELKEARQQSQDSSSYIASLQAAMEQKDSQLNQLLQMVKDREEQVQAMRSPLEAVSEERKEDHRQLEALQSHSKFMKAKIESLKQEISKKDEMVTEHTKAVSELSKTSQTQSKRIKLLEETVTAKSNQCERLQRNVQALTDRLTDKDRLINELEEKRDTHDNKNDQLVRQLKDLEFAIHDRDETISHLTEEVAKMKAGIREKESALMISKRSLAAALSEQSDSSSVVQSLEERLMDKERHIEMLREQRLRYDKERDEEREGYKQAMEKLRTKVKSLEMNLEDTECKLSKTQEDLLSLNAENSRKNTRLISLEQQVVEKELELEAQWKSSDAIRLEHEKADRHRQQLEEDIARLQAKVREMEKLKKEIDKNMSNKLQTQQLRNRVDELEKQLMEREASIDEMERALSSQGTKLAGLRRTRQLARTQNAQLLGQAKQREDEIGNDFSQLKAAIIDKNERITNLEEAVKESMGMIVERDQLLDNERKRSAHAEKELRLSQRQVTELEEKQETLQSRLAGVISQLQDREALIASLRAERQCQTEELMELKQNALLSSISEKDAYIALRETSLKKDEDHGVIQALRCEKDKLVVELKEWTQRRVRFHKGDEDGMDSQLAEKLSDASPDQVLQAIRNMEENMTRLRSYIDQLLAVVLEQSPGLLEGMPRRQQGKGQPLEMLCSCSVTELLQELRSKERDNFNLQGYANLLLQRIMEQQPSILEAVALMQS